MSCPARLAPVLLASLLGSACSAVTPASPNPSEGSTPTRRILANGVRVVVQEFHASDVVAVQLWVGVGARDEASSELGDRKSTRLNSSHLVISYAVFCLKKKKIASDNARSRCGPATE